MRKLLRAMVGIAAYFVAGVMIVVTALTGICITIASYLAIIAIVYGVIAAVVLLVLWLAGVI